MRRCRHLLPLLLAILMIFTALPAPAAGHGVIVVDPPGCDPACPDPRLISDMLRIRSHDVDVEIDGAIATTRIDQVFLNTNTWTAEGTYLFPVPDGAAVGEFRMWVDGEPVEAKVLDAETARTIYEEIVRNLRDPALLEFAGRGLIQASVFPIPPGEERRIQIAYAEVLDTEQGLTHYRYGLDAGRFSAAPLERASISVSIASETPIRAIYSPSHQVAINRIDETHATVGWEQQRLRESGDFDLFFSASPNPVGAHLFSEYDPAADEGHFLLVAAPGIDATAETVAKDVILVLDTSGSMEGEKIEQARTAAATVLERLGSDDRFAIVEFSTGVRLYAADLQPASERDDAIAWVKRRDALGGTDINRALLEAFAMTEPGRPTMVLFLTDGQPTEGVTDLSLILDNAERDAPENVRLFNFGVGYDVDTLLLDALATNHRGRSTYVRPGESIDEAVSGFYAGISAPVLSDLVIDWGGLDVSDISPDPLPDLFSGAQLTVTGRYTNPGNATITLSGEVNGEARAYEFPAQELTADRGDGWVGRLWATRRVGYLLDQIRRSGMNPELIDAIVEVSIRYGIVTPYTSYLLVEDDFSQARGGGSSEPRGGGGDPSMTVQMPGAATGEEAVDAAIDIGGMGGATQASAPVATVTVDGQEIDPVEKVRAVGDRTFHRRNDVWIDSTFDPETDETRKITFLSDDYFRLLADHPELAEAIALGDRVIAEADGVFYEIVTE
jgi:Ca-activated chloride channel homolog